MIETREIVELSINVRVVEHKSSKLLIAMSNDLPGLYVAAQSEDQIEREIEGAIRQVLEAQGKNVISITTEIDTDLPDGFLRHTMVANAKLAPEHCS